MDANDEITVPGKTATRPDLQAVKRAYDTMAGADVVTGIDELLKVCHDDVEMRPYAAKAGAGAGGHELLRGHEEIRAFFRDSAEVGFSINVRTRGFAVEGDTVVVRGSIRVTRPEGSFAETSARWNYRFRDGLVDSNSWEPSAGN